MLGLAVLLSLLFPLKSLLQAGGVDPLALHLQVVDLASVCALAAVLPALLLFRDAQLAHRIPRWSAWVALLATCSLVFLLLHVSWSLELVTGYAREAAAAADLPRAITPHRIVAGLEFASRLGVLAALVGVLLRLDAAPQDELPAPLPAKRRKP
ncbi:hypothetical protein LZ009_19330 [Ramlibacter sp. XY19]|uniref:hypothetical protein n=1 Tax=Ramlibacter paludis TaxID=2908000 RepID=UPI0023DA558D|nr:hypothetical protein [Ramlibacter paludis]MCG2594936.1 hypothetical protein [Ramlibacter paludis]